MKIKKIACLFLAFVLLCGSLVACDSDDDVPPGGEKGDDWANLDFEDSVLTISVSVNDPNQVTFKNAGIYTQGPDEGAVKEAVQKKVLARNKKVAKDLDVVVEYKPTNWTYDQIPGHLEQLVGGDAADAPDIYNNDIWGLVRGMMSGYLWNVTDPGYDAKGNKVTSYFDFDHEAWYKEYMEGATFSKDKQYILVGDYNIDIIRFAWVFFVNIDAWDATFGNLSEDDGWGYNTYESACDYIADTHDWFFDEVITLAGKAHNDAGGSSQGKTDVDDAQIGLCLNNLSPRIFSYGSGISFFEWTKNGKTCAAGEGTPAFVTDTTDLGKVSVKFTELYNAAGVLSLPNSVIESTTMFMDGKMVMSMAELGEMESEDMRATKFQRGILPFPRYSRNVENITTVVHDQAEVTAILNNAKSFNMASAFMQYVNEESVEILDVYYEEVLKFKYNDSKGARAMIDLVHDTIDNPFESVMQPYICSAANATQLYSYFEMDAKNNKTSFKSNYDGARGKLQTQLETALAEFGKLQ